MDRSRTGDARPARGAALRELGRLHPHREHRHRGLRENLFFWRTRTGQELDLWSEGSGVITCAEVKLSARSDDRVFRPLDSIDPSPYRFGRRLLLTLSRDLVEYAPGTWNVPVRFIN